MSTLDIRTAAERAADSTARRGTLLTAPLGQSRYEPPTAVGLAPPVRNVAGTYRRTSLLTDSLAGVLGVSVAWLFRFGLSAPVQGDNLVVLVLLPLLWPLAVVLHRGYDPRLVEVGTEEFRRLTQSGLTLAGATASVLYALQSMSSRAFVFTALVLTFVGAALARYGSRRMLHRARTQGRHMSGVVAIGHLAGVRHLMQACERSAWAGLSVVGVCVPPASAHVFDAIDAVGGLEVEDVLEVVRATGATHVAVTTCPEMDGPALRQLAWALEPEGVELMVAPTLMDVAGPRISIRPVNGLPLMHVEAPSFAGGLLLVKSAIDRVLAALALLVLAPLLLLVAAAVRYDSAGPALFRQSRVGRDGHTFTMIKFRSMVVDAEDVRHEVAELNHHDDDHVLFKAPADPRITRVGRFLRRYSLDELPQLLNVLNGTMSLVGPRPPLQSEVDRYGDDARRRLRVRPGLTGLWQVSGRSDLDWDESVRLDLQYVENWSLALDAMIVWRTAFAVVRGTGAY